MYFSAEKVPYLELCNSAKTNIENIYFVKADTVPSLCIIMTDSDYSMLSNL